MGNSVSTAPGFYCRVRVRDTIAAALVVLAALVGAGTLGLLAEPLRIAGTWLLLLVAFLLGSTELNRSANGRAVWRLLVVTLMVFLTVFSRTDELHQLLLVGVVAACLADCRHGAARSMLQAVALAVLLWTILLIARRSLPVIWIFADRAGELLGHFTSQFSGSRLQIGASFAAVELLVLLAVLYVLWLAASDRARRPMAMTALLAVAAVHLGYLYALSRSLQWAAMLPETAIPEFEHPYTPPAWRWSAAVGTLLPWNLPLLAAAAHVATMGLLWRWSRWPSDWSAAQPRRGGVGQARLWRRIIRSPWLLAALTVAAAGASCLTFGPADLTAKTIVANAEGRLDWQRPVHGRYGQSSAGMFGMLPQLVQSLGGRLRTVERWDDTVLSAADAVVLLHPTTALAADQRRSILDYVRRGGSLLLVAEPHLRDGEAINGHDQLLEDTSISVRRDVMAPATQGWQHAMRLGPHPVTAGVDQNLSHFFGRGGSSLEICWPASPLIVGRWGWSDPGSDSLWSGVQRVEQGERLGDLVIAAEQRFGCGRIVVIGDGYSLTNEGGVRGYVLTGRLLHYLVHGKGSPQSPWRQALTAVLLAGLCAVVLGNPDARRLVWVASLLAVSLAVCQQISAVATRVIPDGRLLVNREDRVPSRLAYIDASHNESYSDSPWAFDGVEGLALTLMRNDLLALSLPQLTRERLEQAGFFVSIGPSRRFSTREQQILVEFVRRGGTLICTVGAEEAGASNSLLARFGIRIPRSPVPSVVAQREPEPMGRLRAETTLAQHPGGSVYIAGVNFFAGWPVETLSADCRVLVYGRNGQPLIVSRNLGEGRAIVIGDTGFAMNKNLEYVGGEPFDGHYENADFWRWLLSSILDQSPWLPPPSVAPAEEQIP